MSDQEPWIVFADPRGYATSDALILDEYKRWGDALDAEFNHRILHGDPDWSRHLPAEARTEMAAELAGLDGERRDVAVAAWKSTAEVYANPELLAALSPTSDDDDPTPPEVAAALARLRDRADVFEPKPAPTPERDGYTIGVYLPPGVRADVREYLSRAIGDLAHTADWHQDWDAHVVGQAGDPLGAVDGTVRP